MTSTLPYTASLFDRLPNELLLFILETAIAPHIDEYMTMKGAIPDYYASLTQWMLISKRWAPLIKNSLVLWSYISIDCQPALKKEILVKCQSPTIPLNVVYVTPRRGLIPHPAVQLKHSPQSTKAEFLQFVCENIKRIKSLVLLLFEREDYELFHQLLQGTTPHLESLLLAMEDCPGPITPLDMSKFSKNIRKLEIGGGLINWTGVSFQNIQRLSIFGIDDSQIGNNVFNALRFKANIEELIFVDIFPNNSNQITTEATPGIFPKLKKLELMNVHESIAQEILQNIERAPALKSVYLSDFKLFGKGLEQDLRQAALSCTAATGTSHLVVTVGPFDLGFACECGAVDIRSSNHDRSESLQWLDRNLASARVTTSLVIQSVVADGRFVETLGHLRNLRIVEICADKSQLPLMDWLTLPDVVEGVAHWALPELQSYEVVDDRDLYAHEIFTMIRARKGLIGLKRGEVAHLPVPLKLAMKGAAVDKKILNGIVALVGNEGLEDLKLLPPPKKRTKKRSIA